MSNKQNASLCFFAAKNVKVINTSFAMIAHLPQAMKFGLVIDVV